MASTTSRGVYDYDNYQFSFIPDTGGFTYQIREYNSATVYTYDSSVQTIQFRIVLEAGSSGKQKARYYYSYDGGSESNVLGSREISNGTSLYARYSSPMSSGKTVVVSGLAYGSTATYNSLDFYLCDGTQSNTSSSGITQTMSLYNGNVGIGTTQPSVKLEVIGDIITDTAGLVNTFTGQHRSYINSYSLNTLENSYGLIVSANKNDYTKLNGQLCKGKDAITISESLPDLSITNTDNDKSVFGVISIVENSNTRTDEYGGFKSRFAIENGDIRTNINSVGEGAIWVSNKNTTKLESGDYITSSSIPGYGMLQSDDVLHNYTVAKITMDCDFNPPTQPVKEILKDSEGNNILDANGFIQWVDSETLTEKKYDLRYLYANSTQMSETTYNTLLAANATVYKAPFVGCTYHCG